MLKNDIDALPLNVRRDAMVAGYLVVCFLALILRMRLLHLVKEAGLNGKYSIEGLFLALILRMRLLHLVKEAGLNGKYSIEGLVTELEKLRLTVFPDGTRVPAEGTRRQRDIFSALSRCA